MFVIFLTILPGRVATAEIVLECTNRPLQGLTRYSVARWPRFSLNHDHLLPNLCPVDRDHGCLAGPHTRHGHPTTAGG